MTVFETGNISPKFKLPFSSKHGANDVFFNLQSSSLMPTLKYRDTLKKAELGANNV